MGGPSPNAVFETNGSILLLPSQLSFFQKMTGLRGDRTKGSFNGIKPVKTSKQNLTITLTRHLLPRNTSIKSAVEFNCATTCRKRPPPVGDQSPNY